MNLDFWVVSFSCCCRFKMFLEDAACRRPETSEIWMIQLNSINWRQNEAQKDASWACSLFICVLYEPNLPPKQENIYEQHCEWHWVWRLTDKNTNWMKLFFFFSVSFPWVLILRHRECPFWIQHNSVSVRDQRAVHHYQMCNNTCCLCQLSCFHLRRSSGRKSRNEMKKICCRSLKIDMNRGEISTFTA